LPIQLPIANPFYFPSCQFLIRNNLGGDKFITCQKLATGKIEGVSNWQLDWQLGSRKLATGKIEGG
jgi:hypothetical protein